MDAQQFAYWLQGFAELNDTPPTKAQWESIREHLALVFEKVTPPIRMAPNQPQRQLTKNDFLPWVQPQSPTDDRFRDHITPTVRCVGGQTIGINPTLTHC